ncbi:hypothetical protein YC2023_114300 [Brassica napus]
MQSDRLELEEAKIKEREYTIMHNRRNQICLKNNYQSVQKSMKLLTKIEIVVVSADPSSLNLADLDLVPQTVAGSDDSILRSTDLSPDVKATSSPAVSQAGLLVLASADANVSLSLQIAEKTVSNVVPDPATDTDKNTSLVKQAAQLKSQSNSVGSETFVLTYKMWVIDIMNWDSNTCPYWNNPI